MARAFLAAFLVACAGAPPSQAPLMNNDAAERNAQKIDSPAAKEWLTTARETLANRWIMAVVDVAPRRDPTGILYFTRDRRTIVVWQVAGDGRIGAASIAESSGLTFLDDVALESVKGARLDPPPTDLAKREFRTAFTVQSANGPASTVSAVTAVVR